jgi:hypothetical protein
MSTSPIFSRLRLEKAEAKRRQNPRDQKKSNTQVPQLGDELQEKTISQVSESPSHLHMLLFFDLLSSKVLKALVILLHLWKAWIFFEDIRDLAFFQLFPKLLDPVVHVESTCTKIQLGPLS